MIEFKRINILFLIAICMLVFAGCNSVSDVQPDLGEISLGNGQSLEKVDDSSLSSDEQNRLQTIAEKLAVRYVNEQSPQEVNIPSKVVSFFYNGLVYLEQSDLDEAKTVTDEYIMVARNPASPREVLLRTDKTKSWLESWREGNTKTGIEEIDNLIDDFGLTLEQYREYDSSTSHQAVATMRAEGPINVYAVGDRFASLPEIEKGGPDRLITGGRNVKAQIKYNYLLLDVTVGSGDCPAGCINKVNHEFGIFSDGEVKHIE